VPSAFGSDDHVRIDADPDRLRMRLRLHQHLDIVEVGEHKFLRALEHPESEPAPEPDEALLRVPVEAAIALDPGQLDPGPDEREGHARVAVLGPHRQALDLGEVGEEPDPQAPRRLVADIADQVGGREIVAVEFLLIRAGLLGHVHRGAQGNDAGEILEAARYGDADAGEAGAVAVVGGQAFGGLSPDEHMQARGAHPAPSGALGKADPFQVIGAFRRRRPRIEIDVAAQRRRDTLQHQCDRRGEPPAGVDHPQIDSSRTFMLPGDEMGRRIRRVELTR
jgi:hypothetical protein